MLLKRLVLQGYKTFATKTEFIFDEGVTAVVGPNGSGKSNVADAVRWVLGEQSYRSLRGRQTTDMIFAGSGSRPRAGMAQVVLTLDNSDGWLPIDFSEVEIGRRAYRSGENEYLLNGQKVRLRDIQELLATSGLAERTYTIIGQGLIDQALSLKSDERRALFEEAAGISHYKSRRAESLRRLQDTERNLQRVFDILSEIRPRLNSLRRQAGRARNYEQVATDLRHLLRDYYGFRWEQMKKELRLRRQEKGAAEKTWQAARAGLVSRQEALNAQRRLINGLERRLDEKQGARDMLRSEIETGRRQVAVLAERQLLLAEQWQALEDELPQLEQQRSAAQAELNEALQALEAAAAEQKAQADALQAFRTEFKSKQAAIDHWRSEQGRLVTAHTQQQQQQAVAEGRLSQLRERLEERDAEMVDEAALAAAEAQVATATAALEAATAEVSAAETAYQEAQAAARDAQQAVRATQREDQALGQGLNQLEKKVAGLEARAEMLAQYGENRRSGRHAPAATRLASGLTIPAAWQIAIEAALKERLATQIVADEEALWSVFAEEPDGRLLAAAVAGMTPLPQPPQPDDAGVVSRAADLVSSDSTVAPLARLLLDSVFLVDGRAAALRVGRRLPAGCLAVCADGFIVHAGGLAELAPADPQSGLLAREAARRAALAALDEARRSRDEQVANRQGLRNTVQEQEAALQETRRAEHEANQALQPARLAQGNARNALDRAKQQQQYLLDQQNRHQVEVVRFRERIAALETEIAQGAAQSEVLQAAVTRAGAELEALPVAEAQQQRQSLQQHLDSARTISAGRKAVVDSRRTTLNQVEAQRERLLQRREEIATARRELDINASQDKLQQFLDAQQQLDEEVVPLQAELKESRERLGVLEELLGDAQSSAHQLETAYSQTNIRLSQQETQIEGLLDRIRADLGIVNLPYDDDQAGPTPLPIAEVVEQLPQVTELPEDIDENIQRYRAQLQRMGGINPEAPAEYDETQTRFDFLTEQVDDLQATEKQLRAIIAELDELTSRAFAETVEKVDKVFGVTFTQLFGGGSARLVLTEPDDLTITGVDIVAQLPRRRQQGLGLLSGGERSLTAVALVFSLLKVSPTPFCVMDEVDAMLDEANVTRFRELLRELSLQTQFVVITHNRGTVQAAQTVYGISMGSDSTSQVISIKPEAFINARELL